MVHSLFSKKYSTDDPGIKLRHLNMFCRIKLKVIKTFTSQFSIISDLEFQKINEAAKQGIDNRAGFLLIA